LKMIPVQPVKPAQLLPFDHKGIKINICHPHITFWFVSRSAAAVPSIFYGPAQPHPCYLQLLGLSLSGNFPLWICEKEKLRILWHCQDIINLCFGFKWSFLVSSELCSHLLPASLLTASFHPPGLGHRFAWSQHDLEPTHTCTQQTRVSLLHRCPLHLHGGCTWQNQHIHPGNPAPLQHRVKTEQPDPIEDVPAYRREVGLDDF